MTTRFVPAPQLAPVPLMHGTMLLIDVARQFFQALLVRLMRRRMKRALEQLSDRMLRDIGIYRGEIDAVVNAHFPHSRDRAR
jgi:uncharacterized protein YjiS (DUF1127 family)